jgi:hypothetical protein
MTSWLPSVRWSVAARPKDRLPHQGTSSRHDIRALAGAVGHIGPDLVTDLDERNSLPPRVKADSKTLPGHYPRNSAVEHVISPSDQELNLTRPRPPGLTHRH